MKQIPIIDLFAGPGGLGEGFVSLKMPEQKFHIGFSIEKESWAHQTLELRAFFRQFSVAPSEYYEYLAGTIDRDSLFDKYKQEAKQASFEAWHAQLGDNKERKGVNPDEVDQRIRTIIAGKAKWVLIGGPPCQAYSLVGRSKMLGEDRKNNTDEYSTDHRHKLYREYLRILARHAPPVFVVENVKGILSSELKGQRTFSRILEDLRFPAKAVFGNQATDLEYKVYSIVSGESFPNDPMDYVVKCEQYGIPQKRHRVILLGVRNNIEAQPGTLKTSQERTVDAAIARLPHLRSGLSKTKDTDDKWFEAVFSASSSSWMNSVSDDVAQEILKTVELLSVPACGRGGRCVHIRTHSIDPAFEKGWFSDPLLKGCCNHETRSHIVSDLHRYLFASCFAKVRKISPKITDFPRALYPKHLNIQTASPDKMIFTDRFRVQVEDQAATTVVSHISRDGHYFIHPDPSQCRSLTVREAARLQTFPDNYFFEGPRTAQYTQVGNAVPPLLARQIAEVVAELLSK